MSERELPRRTFVTIAAGVVGAALAPRAARGLVGPARSRRPRDAAADGAVRLGIASYSLRKFPRAQALEMMKQLRTPFVNFKSVHLPYELSPQQLAEARREIEAAGFQIVGGGTITFGKDTDEDVQRYFEYAKAAGMPLIVGTCAPEVLPRIERFVRRYDIKVAIHNHGPEDRHFPSPYDVLKHVRALDPRVGLCMDIGHSSRAGADIVQAAADAGPRLLDIHAKDLRDAKVKESQCIVGEGVLPIPALFRQLEAMRYAGYVNLEYEIDADDPLPGMKQSFAYMRGVLAGEHTPAVRS
ncbi:MAG TPA: sugar phosphate isomerase/epimerase [Gemmatimonadaceae bacterium]|nr:sugar phosphate isomerase/epimerase [Gemmatimonadaceae bacterium]